MSLMMNRQWRWWLRQSRPRGSILVGFADMNVGDFGSINLLVIELIERVTVSYFIMAK